MTRPASESLDVLRSSKDRVPGAGTEGFAASSSKDRVPWAGIEGFAARVEASRSSWCCRSAATSASA